MLNFIIESEANASRSFTARKNPIDRQKPILQTQVATYSLGATMLDLTNRYWTLAFFETEFAFVVSQTIAFIIDGLPRPINLSMILSEEECFSSS